MPARKRTYDNVFEFVYGILYEGKSMKQSGEDVGFSHHVGTLALKDAVDFKIIDKEQYDKIHYDAYTKKHRELSESMDEEQLRDHYSSMGINSAASNGIDKLVENAIKGGTTTQKHHARKVYRNLRKAKQYGATGCRYNGYNFDSKGERMTGLLLKSYGLLEDLIPGMNFQKRFGNFTADFYIPEKNMIIEYHPIPKQTFNFDADIASSVEEYTRDRKERMKYFFDGEMVVISPPGQWSAREFFDKMKDFDINETWPDFLRRCKTIRKDIIESDKQHQLELERMKEPEEEPPF